jgi:succinate dehydrogenase / fumarate reductase membrane anchor subunit
MRPGQARHTLYWAVNMVSALAILALLGFHMGLIHLDGLLGLVNPAWTEPLAWDRVVARGRSGWFTITYVLLVATALYHGLYGLHTVLTEVWNSPRAAARIAAGCWAAGILLFTVGTTALLVFHFGLAGS